MPAINHDFEAVGKTLIFSDDPDSPGRSSPTKLFTVTGDVLVNIVPMYGLQVPIADLRDDVVIGKEDGSVALQVLESVLETPAERIFYPVNFDIYHTVGEDITAGQVTYYCVFAPLSINGEVESVI